MNPNSVDRATGSPVPVYANVAHVSCTPYDFRLTFSLLSPAPDQPPISGLEFARLEPRQVAEVVVPAAAVPSLVELLRAELDRFSDEFGAPVPSAQQLVPR
jgi:hypothetical protein